MSELLERITRNPKQCGGRPCIRGMRMRVSDVLDLLAAGLSFEEILEEMPDLELNDLKAALAYAFRKLNHPILVACRLFGLTHIFHLRSLLELTVHLKIFQHSLFTISIYKILKTWQIFEVVKAQEVIFTNWIKIRRNQRRLKYL